jgi:hypothetical protein
MLHLGKITCQNKTQNKDIIKESTGTHGQQTCSKDFLKLGVWRCMPAIPAFGRLRQRESSLRSA